MDLDRLIECFHFAL
uniref:Uncharacterized protein n=1 Tax=Anguilla anguilla TaxID=7936 RepID=A0A0E9RLT2_ANGAN